MSAYIDFEDKSVDKAIEKACAQLQVSKPELRYDIISYGSSGIFGLVGTKKALIRVSVPEDNTTGSEIATSADSSDPRAKDPEVSDVSALVDEAFGPGGEESEAADEQSPPADETLGLAEDFSNGRADVEVAGAETEAAEAEIADVEAAVTEETESEEPEAEPSAAAGPVDEEKRRAVVEWVTGFLDQIVALVSPDAKVSVTTADGAQRFQVQGGDSARLIGKRGQTLDAVQYLVDKAVHKQFGNGVQVEIDVEGYLDKRRSDLTDLATRLADKAQQTGKPMVINRINSQDRRVVHLALKENRNVRTQSVGNGDFRKLLILPKKKAGAKKQKNKS
ncbi:MAG: RNA-binding cell elongation regulator Jag/EloR [Thermodesulfobacteriota bacterium]